MDKIQGFSRHIDVFTTEFFQKFHRRISHAGYQYCVECGRAFYPCNQCECNVCGGNVEEMITVPEKKEYYTWE